jgi:hypothetical protein
MTRSRDAIAGRWRRQGERGPIDRFPCQILSRNLTVRGEIFLSYFQFIVFKGNFVSGTGIAS